MNLSIPVATRSKARVCGRSLTATAGSNPSRGMSVVSVVCRQVEVCASGSSPVQRSPTECGVAECDCEALIIRGPWDTRGCCTMRGGEDEFV